MPQQTFRQPSVSSIDRAQNDPAALEVTPKIGFKWKKDSKLSKDLACFSSGKSTNPDGSKKKNKEPDITVAIFRSLKEVTLYEPNLQRVEMEDMKGLEIVLLLGAVVIRDVYFGRTYEAFNITDPHRPSSNSTSPRPAATSVGFQEVPPTARQDSHFSPSRPIITIPSRDPRVPPTDPRSQWEIDAETVRLQKLADAEERARKKRDAAEQKQIRKMLEAEEREKRRRQAEVDQETARLKRLYGQGEQMARPSLPLRPRQHPYHGMPNPYERPQTQPQFFSQQSAFQQTAWGQPIPENVPYVNPAASPSHNGSFGGSASASTSAPASAYRPRLKPKSSFFGFKREGEDQKLHKKRSSLF